MGISNLQAVTANIHFLTDVEKEFMASFDTAEKKMELGEFLKYWNALSVNEQNAKWIAFMDKRDGLG